MKKLFRLIAEITPFVLIILAVWGYFNYQPWQNWCNKFKNRATGFYHIYLGDKALEKSRDPDANISKELTNAVKLYNKGLREFPEHYQARCNLAGIYVLFEDYTSALEQYTMALKYKPDYLECRMDLGLLEVEELSLYDDAIEQFTKVTTSTKKPLHIPFIYNAVDSTKENKINAHYNIGLSYRGKTMFTPKERLKDNRYLKEAVKSYNNAAEAYKRLTNQNFKEKIITIFYLISA